MDCIGNGKMQTAKSTEVFAISMSSNSTLNEPRRDLESQISKHRQRRHSIWWIILVDVPLFLIVAALIAAFELGHLPSNRSGFYCGDPALAFPFNGDTVSTSALISVIILAPIFIVLTIEVIFAQNEYTLISRVQRASRKSLWVYKSYLYGLIFNITIVEVMKGITGRPRPTFFDICEPDTAKTCTVGEYVPSYYCEGTRFSSWLQRDAAHSFPSGHTSLSVYCALFLSWYSQVRAFSWRYRTVFVVPALQLSCFTFAAVSSLTRITDHRHHWWDVLVGFFVGVLTCLYAVAVLSRNFSKLKKDQEDLEDSRLQSSTGNLIYDTPRSIIP